MQNNNPMVMMQQFQQFRQQFQGDPKQKVMELMQSGKISQQQLNQLQSAASAFKQMFNIR